MHVYTLFLPALAGFPFVMILVSFIRQMIVLFEKKRQRCSFGLER